MTSVDTDADPRRLRFLVELAESTIDSDAASAADLARQAIDLAIRLDAGIEQGRAMFVFAQLHDRAGQPALETLEEMVRAVDLLRSGPALTLGRALCFLGRVQLDLSDFTSAVATLQEAEDIGVSLHDPGLAADAAFNIAVSLGAASPKNPSRWEQRLRDARERARALGDHQTEALATYNLGVGHRLVGQFQQARTEFEAARQVAETIGYRALVIDTWANVAMTAAAEGDGSAAKIAAQRAVELVVEPFAEQERAGIELALGCAQLANGDPRGAIGTIERAMALRPDSPAWKTECAPWIVDCYVALGDYKAALDANKHLLYLWEQVRDEQDVSRLRALEVAHRVDQMQREADAERRERQRLELEATRRERELTDELALQIARLRLAEERLADDPLATLPGPEAFVQSVDAELAAGGGVAVGVLTLNRTAMPDISGVDGGDAVMAELVARLRALALTEPALIVGRRSVDLVAAVAGEPAGAFGQLRSIVDRLRAPLRVGGDEVAVPLTGGAASGPVDGSDAQQLLDRADLAARSVRVHRRELLRPFDPVLEHHRGERRFIERALREALEYGGLELHYQPEVACESGRVVGAEALLRWTHPERGPIAPGIFIPIAEETDLIIELGAWVLRQACRQAAAWRHLAEFVLSVNVSVAQVVDGAVVNEMRNAVATVGLPHGRLAVELTETMLVEDELVPRSLAAIRDLGVAVLLDDFGTGYSSLSYLGKLPLDAVKIDRSFIADVDRESSRAALTQAMITMAHSLGLTAIAEGVERAEELAVIRAQGCDVYQGWLFSRAVPADELERLLALS